MAFTNANDQISSSVNIQLLEVKIDKLARDIDFLMETFKSYGKEIRDNQDNHTRLSQQVAQLTTGKVIK